MLANDGNDEYRRIISENLCRSRVPRGFGDDERRWAVTHFDANRLMTECYLQRDLFDLIDVDSFGSDSSFLRSAMNALKLDGLLYITSTDGYTSGGHRPSQSVSYLNLILTIFGSNLFVYNRYHNQFIDLNTLMTLKV